MVIGYGPGLLEGERKTPRRYDVIFQLDSVELILIVATLVPSDVVAGS